jgi:OFA family oxalate/formate antiporter-like MFS transporter
MIDVWGVDGALFLLGILVFIVAISGAWLVRNPPPEWIPPQKADVAQKAKRTLTATKDVPPDIFIRTPVFYGLWAALAAVIGGGLTAIGLLTPFGELYLKLPPAEAAISISLFSLINGIGRPFAGWLGDRFGAVRIMIIVYIVQALVFIVMPWAVTSLFLLLASSLLLGTGYAVTFALFPVIVASSFGTKFLGVNYGLVFSAFGVGAVTGFLGSHLLDTTGSFTPAFLLAGGTTLIGIVILVLVRKKLD